MGVQRQHAGTRPRLTALFVLGACLAAGSCAAPPTPAPPPPHQVPLVREAPDAPPPLKPPEPVQFMAFVHVANPDELVRKLDQSAEGASPEERAFFDARVLVEAGLAHAVDTGLPLQVGFVEHKGEPSEMICSLGLGTPEAWDPSAAPHCRRHDTSALGARLVCSEAGSVSDGVLAAFERAALRKLDGDVVLALPAEVIEGFGAKARAKPPQQDPAAAFGSDLTQDLLDALGGIDIALSLDPRAKLTFDVEVRDASALLPSLLVGDAAESPPPAFNGLPSDAHFAVSLRGLDPSAMTQAAAPVWQRFEAHLDRFEPRAQVSALMPRLRQLFLTGGPLLFASGPPGPKQVRLGERSEDRALQRLARKGWWSVGLNEPLEHWTRGIGDLIELEQKPLPLAPGEAAKERRTPKPTVTFVRKHPVPGRSGLPRGTLHFRVWETSNPEYVLADGETPPIEKTTYVYVTGKPPTTWVVGSEHDDLALARAHELIQAQSAGERSRFFESSAPESARLLGFTTLQGLAAQLLPDSPASVPYTLNLTAGNGWPEHLELPVRYSIEGGRASKHARLEVELPYDIVARMTRIAMRSLVLTRPPRFDYHDGDPSQRP